jgi:CRISPR-associated protein Cmr4
LKGTFADAWSEELKPNKKGEFVRILKKSAGDSEDYVAPNLTWLFGSDDADSAWAGAIQFSEAKLLAFPIRSAKGSFAWITCPLMLERASGDGVLDKGLVPQFPKPAHGQPDKSDELAFFGVNGPLALKVRDGNSEKTQVVLEEYTFTHTGELPNGLGKALADLLQDDPVWAEVKDRLVILSNGMMSFFAQNACEVAQHVRINDETGTAAGGALFNQENVPSEAFFYSVLHAFDERTAHKAKEQRRPAAAALAAFEEKADGHVFQFGGDASTGLGYCTVKLDGEKKEVAQ